MIKQITFSAIYHIWEAYLWHNKTSTITPTSAMDYLGGYHMQNMECTPTFFGYFDEHNNLLGVNSGHKCRDNSYRSRGLYVHGSFRNRGIATELLISTIEQGKKEGCSYVWSYPRENSWKAYAKAGFTLTSDWTDTELGKNAYCRIDLF